MQRRDLIFTLIGSIVLGAGVAAASPGDFARGWLAAGLLLALVLAALLWAWRWAGASRRLAWMLALAFLLRLGLSTGLTLILPSAGYDEPEQRAGYFFYDAWRRDSDAWSLASSGQPVWSAFGDEIATDQYGGLLAVSALTYRVLSPDAHRPLLVVILAAGAAAFGIPFFYRAAERRWGSRVAGLGGWILALYPESVFLGASQMREPFLIGLSAVAFWGVAEWGSAGEQSRSRAGVIAGLAGALAGMVLISSRAALPVAGLLVLWFWVERVPGITSQRLRRIGWIGLLLAGAAAALLGWLWVRGVMDWDVLQAVRNSGSIQRRLAELGEFWLVPFVALYGVVRPILPAVVTDPDTVLLWRAAWLLRAAGWYALAPLLVYGLVQAVREVGWNRNPSASLDRKKNLQRWLMVGFAALAWVWILISSIRAGGDQTDNPRYRTILLVWLALLASWAWVRSRETGESWLGRALAVEGIFLVVVTQWYAARHLGWGPLLPFWAMLGLVAVLSLAAVGGGWLLDRRAKAR